MARQQPFTRLAIVNRGEAAMRLIHAVRELNETREEPIRLIAFYTEPERRAMFVRQSDEAYVIDSYLDHAGLERALVESRADAAWVGWGFVAEHPDFAELCERLDIVFVGPDSQVMRVLGDKVEAKRLAEESRVPVARWSDGPVETIKEALAAAKHIGFPLMVKAAAGGGGRGIRRVDALGDLHAAFESASSEARKAFGSGSMLLERVLSPARHVEVQVIADGCGSAWAVGVRDCSLQRRNQKVVEESSSPALNEDQERLLKDAAVRLILRAGYRNAATVEFLYEPALKHFSFMEVNARLQVEHPVTEAVTGLDLVKLQLHVAAGGRLDGEPPASVGHAVEARLCAEDPALGFAPAPGRIALLRLPSGPGIRVDTGVAQGDVVPAEFDSMIAKIIAWGTDRAEALARLRRALADTTVVIDGGATNQSFLLELLGRAEVRTGEIETTLLDRPQPTTGTSAPRHGDIALLQAAIDLADAETAADRARFYVFARRGRPQSSAATARKIELRHRGHGYRIATSQIGPSSYRLVVDGASIEARLERLSSHERRIEVAGEVYRTVTSRQGDDLLIDVDGVPQRISRDAGGIVRNLAPAVVVSVPVKPGDEVEAGEVVAVVESMKMESSLTAPFRGRVREVMVGPNMHVAAQAPLVRLDALETDRTENPADRVSFTTDPPIEAPERCRANLGVLERLTLGYDIDPGALGAVIEDLHGACADPLACDPAVVPGEHRLIELFADLRALTKPHRDEVELAPDLGSELGRSPQEHLHAYLRSLDASLEGLPPTFEESLTRALSHYGVTGLDRTPALEHACYRLFLSEQRSEPARRAVIAILDRRLEQAGSLVGLVPDDFRSALDRLIDTSEGRDQVLVDLAREVRFRYYDEPLIEAARQETYAEMEEHLEALTANPARDDRDQRIAELVSCPRPLTPLLSRVMGSAGPRLRRVLLEVMTRRYYRMHPLQDFEDLEVDRFGMLTARYTFEDHRFNLATWFIGLDDLADAARAFALHASRLPEGELAVADFYAVYEGDPPPREQISHALLDVLAGVELPKSVHRIVVAVAKPGQARGISAVDFFTFHPGDYGLVEDEVLKGLHPMMGERLELWRLEHFALQPLHSPEDVYLFRGVAKENSKDERLFALAEVRDLTSIRDSDGKIESLPELERAMVDALEGIREFQAHREPSRRLHWNRVLLYVWPTIELHREELGRLVHRMSAATLGLGIETVLVCGRMREGDDSEERDVVLRFITAAGGEPVMEVDDPPRQPLRPLDESARRISSARRRGTAHPAEIVNLIAPGGGFAEHDFDEHGKLVPVDRPPATNDAGIVVGLMRNFNERYPEGMLRVALLGDPTHALGSLAEPECMRIMAALDMAEELGVPLEWFALSAGAKIAMDSGTENMDWIAAVLRRIIEFTQRGGELNVVVTGINVGAQPYWNAEATMLMHTSGILVMTPDSAMVLTGKQALDYSGGVSADDNFGIGGYERVMGPNGQAQYWAPNLPAACRLLLNHYEHTYVAPGERFPRRADTSDPIERDVSGEPHFAPGSDLRTVGDIFSDDTNPGRKAAFDIRSVMRAAVDHDHPPLERWAAMRDAENAVVWEAHLGGWPVMMLGIESRPLSRHGMVPADGPQQWTSGTLFPRSSKKIARAINATSGRRPVVVLANLAGFDGSPDSMRGCQLEFGAEIGRAVVNFDGPIVFCVVSRYHGGAFVVFSQKLNENLETVALEGAKASVIGGAPAAAVVFARDVDSAARADERIASLDERIATAEGAERQRLRLERAELWTEVRNEKMGELAAEFDNTHSVERAVQMGSVSRIISPTTLRPYLVDAVERGMRRTLEGAGSDGAQLADALVR